MKQSEVKGSAVGEGRGYESPWKMSIGVVRDEK
jgi:hypothetical protein